LNSVAGAGSGAASGGVTPARDAGRFIGTGGNIGTFSPAFAPGVSFLSFGGGGGAGSPFEMGATTGAGRSGCVSFGSGCPSTAWPSISAAKLVPDSPNNVHQ
jgi:hypothetical protein